jgi:hydrogenase expression/formation protein HypE
VREVGVTVACGDTKVVERGKGDGLFVTTTGLGVVADGVDLGLERIRPGDAVLVSGPIGDHGTTILSTRAGLAFASDLVSDTAPLHDLVRAMLATGAEVRAMRDPTRGGLGATLNEIAHARGLAIELEETAIPIRPEVRGACELLGLDPLYLASEGRLVAFVAADDAAAVLGAMRAHPHGREAAPIGRVGAPGRALVTLRTGFGGRRVVDWIVGEQLPRIC